MISIVDYDNLPPGRELLKDEAGNIILDEEGYPIIFVRPTITIYKPDVGTDNSSCEELK